VQVAALAWLAGWAAALSSADLRTGRLPAPQVRAFGLGLVVLHLLAVAGGEPLALLAWAAAGAALMAALFLVVHLSSPRSLGGGDVRLAVPLGWQVGWSTGDGLVGGLALLLVAAALVTVVGGTVARRGRLGSTPLPFGPGLLLAALLVGVVEA